jgi:hypothetical protein
MPPLTRPLLTSITIVLVSLAISACGDTGQGAHSGLGASSAQATSSSGAATSSSAATPVPGKSFGDYDHDDYFSGENDGDNDDSDKPKDRDNDSDSNGKSYYDGDDSFRGYGHPVSTADKLAVTALLKRYYAAAAAANGATACTLLNSKIEGSVVENLGRPPEPAYFRGNTCATVMSKVFALNHRQLSAYAARLTVSTVLLNRTGALAVLDFKTLPGRVIAVTREHGVWKVGSLLDDELP